MSKLSIVIPALGGPDRLEQGLVSVLQHRPADAQVVVVLREPYADPYDLKDEVLFVQAPPRATPARCLNLGLRAADGDVIHFLDSGAEVADVWADRALVHFDNPLVAVVVPAHVDAEQGLPASAAGSADGRVAATRRAVLPVHPGAAPLLAVQLRAGFYRRAAIDAVGGLSEQLGDQLPLVDLALALKRAGLDVIVEPSSVVALPPADVASDGAFRRGLYAERLFWRNVPEHRRLASLFWHPLVALQESLAAGPLWATLPHLLGRTLACCQLGDYVLRHHQVRQLARLAQATRDAYCDTYQPAEEPARIDPKHQADRMMRRRGKLRAAG